MNHHKQLAIIGSGPSAIYLLKHVLDEVVLLKDALGEISIFEKSGLTGMGMPYSPESTDRFNMSNISSEELPELLVSFADWLRAQDSALLESLDLGNVAISDHEVYSRLALGQYLNAQYRGIISRLADAGIPVREFAGCGVVDMRGQLTDGRVSLFTGGGDSMEFDKVVIATGHYWPSEDEPGHGYYASPWPISKLLPKEGEHHNFVIGTLGASLSAFDVIASLAHRHGDFVPAESGGLKFLPHPGTGEFKIVMHSAHGLLPHLQFDQDEPFREIYRKVTREDLLKLIDRRGFLRIDTYYDEVCRPALIKAFGKDGIGEMATLLGKPQFGLREFIAEMTAKHDYTDAFEGMRFEMQEAEISVINHKPIHWKEVIDDLMYTLNFHAELMPAEDHLLLQSLVMPFLLNVVAAMPLNSGNTILALHDAGKLGMIPGKVSMEEGPGEKGVTRIRVEDGDSVTGLSYRMFIDCSGQKALRLEDFPFPGLVKEGRVRPARAVFANSRDALSAVPENKKDQLFREGENIHCRIGGVDIDGMYRLVGQDGKAHPGIYDIAFPHTTGIRPYSYGLQACNHTSAIVVKGWVEESQGRHTEEATVAEVMENYEKVGV